jgi:PAS domain S-box-containing protein
MTPREEELEHLLRSVFIGSAAGIAITTPDGRYLRANPAQCEILGRTEAEIIGRSFYEHTHPDDRARNADAVARLLAGEQDRFILEKRNIASGERVVHVRTTVSLVRTPGGEPLHLIGVAEDITEIRNAEERLRRSASLLRLAGSMARVGGWAYEPGTGVVSWSDEVYEILDQPRDLPPSVDGSLASYDDEGSTRLRDAVLRCAANGTPIDLELQRTSVDGRTAWLHFVAEAERDRHGAITRVVGAIQDVTQQRRMEQQFLRAQRMESIGTLASGIAHDLNNVLAPILMSIELLQLGEDDPQRRNMLGMIQTSAKRGADMVRQVLAFARGVEGQHGTIRPDVLVHDVARIVRDTFPKEIRLDLRVPADLSPIIGDQTQLHQVLLNLCVNARDAMHGGGTLHLAVRNVEWNDEDAPAIRAVPGRYVRFEVTDDGIGMPPDVLDKVFEPFFTTKELGQGTGLGLSTSLAIVTSHGGFIDVRSNPGRGTRFHVFLPVSASPVEIELDPSGAMQIPRGRGELVLVVDDEEAIRDVTCDTLEAFGYRTVAASDGAAGVRVFDSHPDEIDLVLTDMMMPVVDGPAMVRQLRGRPSSVPIIAVSGLDEGDRVAEARAAGVDLVLAKPFTAETLLLSVRDALTRSS